MPRKKEEIVVSLQRGNRERMDDSTFPKRKMCVNMKQLFIIECSNSLFMSPLKHEISPKVMIVCYSIIT